MLPLCFCAAVISLAILVQIDRGVPLSNTRRTHFDAIIVLGYTANSDGSISDDARSRVLAGIREYRAGVAPRLLFTGGPAHNRFVEADVMAAFAESQGIPASAILEERQAQDTIQNAYYSVAILRAHGWSSAEIVTAPYHIPRSALIFSHFPIEWRAKAGAWPPEYDYELRFILAFREVLKTDSLRLFGFKPSPFLPR
nr:YdcF family protein [Paracidobacterium acidisoli]